VKPLLVTRQVKVTGRPWSHIAAGQDNGFERVGPSDGDRSRRCGRQDAAW
jgi:hypothetical protein